MRGQYVLLYWRERGGSPDKVLVEKVFKLLDLPRPVHRDCHSSTGIALLFAPTRSGLDEMLPILKLVCDALLRDTTPPPSKGARLRGGSSLGCVGSDCT